MPSIIINDRDLTTVAVGGLLDNVVYIPGVLGKNKDGEDAPTLSGKPELFLTLSDFKNKIGKEPKDLSYIMAEELLIQGLPVLYEAFAEATLIESLAAQPISDASAPFSQTAFERLADRAEYPVKYITGGGYEDCMVKSGVEDNDNSINIIQNMIKCAEKRGDAIALIDHAKFAANLTASEKISKIRTDLIPYLTGTEDGMTSAKLSYASAFAPYGRYTLSTAWKIGDDREYTKERWLPASFGYLLALAKSIRNNPNWFAIAGINRGIVPKLVDIDVEISRSVSEAYLQSNAAPSINPIIAYRNNADKYYTIWGNRTLALNQTDLTTAAAETHFQKPATDVPSNTRASSYLNVRQLVCDLKKVLYSAASELTFEQNSDVLWVNFKSKVLPTLDFMVSNQGIRDYKIQKVRTNTRGALHAKITIVPIEAVEDWTIDIELTDADLTVND